MLFFSPFQFYFSISALKCLMTTFYVHNEANFRDLELRRSVADTMFVYLPKTVSVLVEKALGDETLGDTIRTVIIHNCPFSKSKSNHFLIRKSTSVFKLFDVLSLQMAVTALSRILHIIYEDMTMNDDMMETDEEYDIKQFNKLAMAAERLKNYTQHEDYHNKSRELLDRLLCVSSKKNKKQVDLVNEIKEQQKKGRTSVWLQDAAMKLKNFLQQISILRAHQVPQIREEFGKLCSNLLLYCTRNLQVNFSILLECTIALSEDSEQSIADLASQTLCKVQNKHNSVKGLNQCAQFGECIELLFDQQLLKLPRIIQRHDEMEQYAELLFLKGLLKILNDPHLEVLLVHTPRNREILCTFLYQAIELELSDNLLEEQLNDLMRNEQNNERTVSLPWRRYKNLSSDRCIRLVTEICNIIGSKTYINELCMDYLMELFRQQRGRNCLNEVLLIMLWLAEGLKGNSDNFIRQLLYELQNDEHWNLALEPDQEKRLQTNNVR